MGKMKGLLFGKSNPERATQRAVELVREGFVVIETVAFTLKWNGKPLICFFGTTLILSVLYFKGIT